MPDANNIDYIDSIVYTDLEDKLKELDTISDDLDSKIDASRKLRYDEVDIEAERESGRLQPDELYVPQHIIDTNIRREQSPYVQYVTQSPRAVILDDLDDSTYDLSLLEKDLTKKLRYDKWQLSKFANIDGMQAYGYGVMEVIQDLKNPGQVALESVQYCDFAFISDTRDSQDCEILARKYYFTKTRLVKLCGNPEKPDPANDWDRSQVDKIISKDPDTSKHIESSDVKDKSLYRLLKVMTRVKGIVHVGWCCPNTCDDWVFAPRPLFIGRKKMVPSPIAPSQPIVPQQLSPVGMPQQPPAVPMIPQDDYETEYPYILYPYLISENDTISQLKGRIFLDQDLQEAVTSLLSSTVTKARRSAGLYFSKDVSDPNDDLLMQKNIFFRSGCLINSKVTEFELKAPDPAMFSAIQMLVTANQNETSQVNFAVNNRKDSRKTAKEIEVSEKQEATLSTVQVVLFSIAEAQAARKMCAIIKSRVAAGLIMVTPQLKEMYARNWQVKPAGDVDVIEKQQTIQKMMNAWPVVQNTPMAEIFLMDLLGLMFPDRVENYRQILQQSKQQSQDQHQQMMQQMLQFAAQMAQGIVSLAKHPEYFSDIGRIHAYPIVELTSEKIQQIQKQMQGQGQAQPKQLTQ